MTGEWVDSSWLTAFAGFSYGWLRAQTLTMLDDLAHRVSYSAQHLARPVPMPAQLAAVDRDLTTTTLHTDLQQLHHLTGPRSWTRWLLLGPWNTGHYRWAARQGDDALEHVRNASGQR